MRVAAATAGLIALGLLGTTRAKVLEIRPQRIHEALAEGAIVLVAGFQGVSTAHEVTTLGRGYREITSCSNTTDFQANNLGARMTRRRMRAAPSAMR